MRIGIGSDPHFDGRNLYNPDPLDRFGITYYPIGRARRPRKPRRRVTDFA